MQLSSLKTVGVIVVAAFLIFPLSKKALTQEPPKQQTNVSESQLRSFAKVYVEVEKIRQTYEPRLKEAKDPQESNAIQKDAVSKMQKALTKEGLTEESYSQIFEIARADESLRKKTDWFDKRRKTLAHRGEPSKAKDVQGSTSCFRP